MSAINSSSLLQGFQSLKKTSGPKQVSTHIVAAKSICKGKDDYNRLMQESFFEQYCEDLKDCSFGYSMQPLSKEQAMELSKAHASFLLKMTSSFAADNVHDSTSSKSTVHSFDSLRRREQVAAGIADELIEQSTVLQSIADCIQKTSEKHDWHRSGTFIRLSSRSPKDACLYTPGFTDAYLKHKENITKQYSSSPSLQLDEKTLANVKIRALYAASTSSLRLVGNDVGVQATRLLIQSHRIQDDLQQYAEGTIGIKSNESPFNFIIREFRTFDVQHELRGFVYNRKLTALTQYNELVYFPLYSDAKYRNTIVQLISKQFEFIVSRNFPASLNHCVVDFVICFPTEVDEERKQSSSSSSSSSDASLFGSDLTATIQSLNTMKVYIIELNPFAEFAGSGMFDWIRDRDILTGSKGDANNTNANDNANAKSSNALQQMAEDSHSHVETKSESRVVFRCVQDFPHGQNKAKLDGDWNLFLQIQEDQDTKQLFVRE
jgi:hypothetical protein